MKKIKSVKYIFLTICLFIAVSSFAQNNNNNKQNVEKTDTSVVYTLVEQMPMFPGGEGKMYQFVSDNIVYPDSARLNSTMGKVFVDFIIDKSGNVRHPKILKGVTGKYGELLEYEAIRIVSIMPQWKPGFQNGKPVSVSMNLPIKFHLK